MASLHRGNTLAAEGDRPAEQPEGSSKNAIQSPTVDAAWNMELVLFKKPILDLSPVVTRNTLEDFAEPIPGLEQVLLGRLNESENAQPSNHIRETDDEYPLMTWADLFDGTYSPWYEYRDAGCFGYVCPPAWDGLDWSSRVRGHKVEFLGIKDLEAAAISVLARVAPLIQKMEATTKLEEVD
ncbi:Hypothetical protein NCS54_01085100 [Fusarium falciforme]|uniref:Hypothetical protein n=1 Tax=Fusarium falciforme TaxID=195108 RepID=UPI002301A50F|nr:Hypothetical protein NCS54_01085100 [Fusarium falciforme]WAO93309.1 Hypothetical protein NCS54_01085100 [Fusarium falciforme]